MKHVDELLWPRLRAAGIVRGVEPGTEDADSPWFVKVLLAFSGWLAALFILGFIAAALYYLMESAVASFITGAAMIGAAFAVFRVNKNEFFDHLALAISLAGQAMICWSLITGFRHDHEIVWLLMGALQIALAVLIANSVHRGLCALFGVWSLSVGMTLMGAPFMVAPAALFAAAFLLLHEFDYPRHTKAMRAIAYGLLLGLIPLKGSVFYGFHAWLWRETNTLPWTEAWMGDVLGGAVLFYIVSHIFNRYARSFREPLGMAILSFVALLWLVSLEANGLSTGLAILLVGFMGANRLLLGLGVASLLLYVSWYYYSLDLSLMAKSATLLTVGVLLLGARWMLPRLFPREWSNEHA